MDIKTEKGEVEKQALFVLNLEDVCRVCLVSGELEPLEDSRLLQTYQLLVQLLNLEIDRELPNNICKSCSMDLERISYFVSRLKESTDILQMSQENERFESIVIDNLSNGHVSIEYIDETDAHLQDQPENNNDDIGIVKVLIKSEENHIVIQQNNVIQENLGDNTNDDIERVLIEYNDAEQEENEHSRNLQKMVDDAKLHKIPALICHLCGQSFDSEKAFDSHVDIHTQNDSDTEEVIKLEIETKPEIEKPHSCNICKKGFVYEISLKYHMTSHTQEKLCECSLCDWTGINEFELNEHTKRDHYYKSDNSEAEKELQEHSHSHKKQFKCQKCGLSFRKNSTLMKHLHHHKEEGLFSCNYCDKVLTRKMFLRRHIQLVHCQGPVEKPEPIYFCSTCNKGFFFKKNLVKHEELHQQELSAPNQEPDQFPCQHCGKKFTFKANLLRHIRITHVGVKKFACTLCDEKFTVKNSLIYHMNIHNNAKPYECEICSRGFRQPSALIRHKRQVHLTKDKHFKCEICDKLLKSNVSLRAHLKRHEC